MNNTHAAATAAAIEQGEGTMGAGESRRSYGEDG